MASLLDAARVRAATKKHRQLCTIAIVKQIHPEAAKDVDALIAECGPDTEIPYAVAAETLIKELNLNLKFKGDVVSRHKRHVCSCP